MSNVRHPKTTSFTMTSVLEQRKWLLTALVGLAIALHTLFFEFFPKLVEVLPFLGAKDSELARFLKLIAGAGGIYSFVVLFPLWLYDKWLWRFLNPGHDLVGSWKVTVPALDALNEAHLTQEGMAAAAAHIQRLTNNEGVAQIRQTPFRIWVQSGLGFAADSKKTSPVTWRAEGIAVNLPGSLSMVFEGADGGEYSGRDYLYVEKTDWRGRPTSLVGNAFHVTTGTDFVYRGKITYKRQ